MFKNFSWYLRECALRDYVIWEEREGQVSTRAYYRSQRFLAMADFLYPTHTPFDLEYEYCSRKGDFDFEDDY